MKRRIFFIFAFCFLLFVIKLFAQDTWVKTYEPFGDVDYFPEDIVVCSDGGYAVNGYYFYYDPEFGIEEEWGFLMKTDSDGNLLWADLDNPDFLTQTRSNAFVEISDGDFISAGWNNINNNYLLKRDFEGNILWAQQYDFGVNSMCNTEDGFIIIGGNLGGIALRKIDNDGNEIWTKSYQINENYSVCTSIIHTNDEGYLLTGYGYFESQNTSDILVMKTDANGDSLWTRTFDAYGGWDRGKSITEDSNNNILVAGSISAPGTTGFLWYLDEEGNTIWTEEIDGNVGNSILSLPDNSFVAYCYKGNRESQIYGFDSNYNIQWEGSVLDGTLGRGDRSFCSEGEYFLCLLSEVGGFMEDNIGIAKTDSQGQIVSIDNNEIPYIDDIILTNYPNPFNPETKISFNLPANIENPIIEIFNIKGEKIRVINCQNQMPIIWDGTDNFRKQVSSGIYLYRLKNDEGFSVSKKMLLLK